MSDRGRELLLDVARNTVLTLEATYNEKPATIRYRLVPLLKARSRFPGGIGVDAPILNTLTAFADSIVALVVDGQTLATGRAAMTTRTFETLLHMIPHISEHAEKWLEEQSAPGGELYQQVERRAKGRRR